MGIVQSLVLRPFRRFNVENRAMRAIERKKPVTAPRHNTSKQQLQQLLEETPEVKADLAKKHKQLDQHLKNVFVTSNDMVPEIPRNKSILPQEKRPMEDEDYGFKLPSRDEIPVGFVHLEDALKLITDHQGDPRLWTASALAKEYKLDEKVTVDVLEHFRTFNVYIPKVAEDKGGIYSWKKIKRDSIKNLLPTEKERLD